jgi:dolichyl-phosphate-mannose-protein mannosyltransferase
MEQIVSKLEPKEWASLALPICLCLMVLVGLSALLTRGRERFSLELPRKPLTRSDLYIALSIAGAFYLVGLWRLDVPQKAVFDECYHGRSGMEYLLGLNPTEWTHPPLGKLLIASSLKVWGGEFNPREGTYKPDNLFSERAVIGWRFASLASGALALLVLYALARSMLGNTIAASVATGLLACDGIFFVQSRIAMTNAFTVMFILVAALGAWKYRQTEKKPWLLLLTFGLSCAVATRWSTFFALALLGLYLTIFEVRRLLAKRAGARAWLGSTVLFALTFLVIPAAFYLASYIPFVLQGPGTTAERLLHFDKDESYHGWWKVITEQVNMWNYHTGMKETHGYASPWWTWPLTIRPTWYAFTSDPLGDTRQGIVAIGNAGIWWASIPAMIVGGVLAVRDKRAELGLPVALATGLWVLWGVQKRSLVFQHYMLEAIPFVCILLAALGCLLWQKQETDDSGSVNLRRLVVGGWGVLTVGWFVFWYPLLSNYPVSGKFFDMHLWLGKLWV